MSLGKPQWFKLHPAEFLSDARVDSMNTLEIGACFRLLCRQWLDGFIPDDPRVLARLCRLNAAAMRTAWITLDPFFPPLEPGSGKRANRFMFLERAKVATELDRKSDEGTRLARRRWDAARNAGGNAHGNAVRMPDAIQEKSREEKSREEKPSLSEQGRSDVADGFRVKQDIEADLDRKAVGTSPSKDAVRLAALLKSEILRNKPDFNFKQATLRSWETVADRLLRIDKRDPQEAAELIQLVANDSFWRPNVLCMEKFRKQYDQLAMKLKPNGHAATNSLPDNYVPESDRMRERLARGER